MKRFESAAAGLAVALCLPAMRGIIAAIIAAAALVAGCSTDGGATVTVHTIDYLVMGDSGATATRITYNTGGGGQQQETEVPLPWSTKFTTGEGSPALVVLAQNAGGGSIACAILVDGQNVSQQVSKGQHAVVTCSGT